MNNPWLSIPASEYDEHLAHPLVRQREFLDAVFRNALTRYQPRSVALLSLPQLELIHADLESCELDARAYEFIGEYHNGRMQCGRR